MADALAAENDGSESGEKPPSRQVHEQPIVMAEVVVDSDEQDAPNYRRQMICIILFLVLVGASVITAVVLIKEKREVPAGSPVSGTDSPTNVPATPAPTVIFDPPTLEECQLIRNKTSVDGQEDMLERRFRIETDITLDSQVDIGPYLNVLKDHVVENIVTELAGCPAESRRELVVQDGFIRGSRDLVENNYVIANGAVEVERDIGEQCEENAKEPCFRVLIHLNVFLKAYESKQQTASLVADVVLDLDGTKDPFVTRLGLDSPFERIDIVKLVNVILISV